MSFNRAISIVTQKLYCLELIFLFMKSIIMMNVFGLAIQRTKTAETRNLSITMGPSSLSLICALQKLHRGD